MEEENTKHKEKVYSNRDTVSILLKLAQEEGYLELEAYLSDECNLEVCTLNMFGGLKVPELKSIIIAHDDELMRMKDIPNKGNVKEAKEHGVMNTIMVAYNWEMKPNLLDGKQPHTAEDLARFADDDEDEPDTNEVNVSTVRLGEVDKVLPSDLLGCHMWRANSVKSFNFDRKDGEMHVDLGAEVDEDLKVKGDLLVRILRQRFKTFLK